MPRSGRTYTLPAGSIAANGQISDATLHNENPFTDIEAELNRLIDDDDALVASSGLSRLNRAAVVADNILSYTTGAGLVQVVAGQIVSSQEEQISYLIVASGATDHDFTNANGVKMQVLPGPKGLNIRGFGALASAGFNNSVPIFNTIKAALARKTATYVPPGTFIINGGAGLTNNRIEPILANGDSIILNGDGPDVSIIKQADGATATHGAFHMMLYLRAEAGVTIDQVIIRDLTFDKNGASNGAPPTTYAWEQSHCVALLGNSTGKFRHVLVENVETLDKVGGGIVFAGGEIETVRVANTHGRNFSGLFGQRGDVEFQATIGQGVAEGCSGDYIQSEPTAASPTVGVKPRFVISNSKYDVVECSGYSTAVEAQDLVLENVEALTKLTVRNGKLLATGSTFQVGGANDEYWSRLAPGSLVDGCRIIVRYDGVSALSSFYPRAETTLGGFDLTVRNTLWEPGPGASVSTTGWAISSLATYTGAQPYRVVIEGCVFSPLFEATLDAYRNGNYIMRRCKIAGRSATPTLAAMRVGGTTTTYGALEIEDCDYSQVTSTYKTYLFNGNALWKLTWKGSHNLADLSYFFSAASYEPYVSFEGDFFTDTTAPSGPAIAGARVRKRRPVFGTGEKYICTVSNITTATWRLMGQAGVAKDVTANRPATTAVDQGLQYFDTTLDADGKLIWWNGAAWVDATGAVV